MRILEKDRNDYKKAQPGVNREQAFENLREMAVKGQSLRDHKLQGLKKKKVGVLFSKDKPSSIIV